MRHPSTRRMYRRIDQECHACILTSSTIRRCLVRDLSLSGFRIAQQGEGLLLPNTSVMIRVWLPGGAVPIDIDQATVRWERGNEVGVEILSISHGADFQLAGCIERILRQAVGEGFSGDDVGSPVRGYEIQRRMAEA